jgi:hypothetical protein
MKRTVATRIALSIGVLLVSLLSVAPAGADSILIPAGLNPGDQFRIVFLSSATRNAVSADIADYDQFITDLAVASGLDTYFGNAVTWRALGSTATVEAIDRLPGSFASPPLYGLDGGLVSPSTRALWVSGPASPITITESGVDLGGAVVWTGTLRDGSGFEPLGAGAFVAFGFNTFSGGGWVAENDAPRGQLHHLYGYSSVLTVPQEAPAVPEPGTLTLMLIGLAAGVRTLRRRTLG